MSRSPTLTYEDLAQLCGRAFPDRPRQTVAEVKPIDSRQHEMTTFELWWYTDGGVLKHENLIVRRYVSQLSWWRPDDYGKAQREATVCRWLKTQDFPVPAVYAREFTPDGDVVLFERLPNQEIGIGGGPLKQAIEPYIRPFAEALAHLHSLTPSIEVQQVVPEVTLPMALANLMAVAFQIDQPALQQALDQVMARVYDVKESRPVLLHGDYHFLNALFFDGELSGVVDWEYAAIGDPRWDVSNAYMQLVDFGAAEAADKFLHLYLEASGREFEGPPLYNIVAPLQQWAISEWLVKHQDDGQLEAFALAQDLVEMRDIHHRRALMALQWLDR